MGFLSWLLKSDLDNRPPTRTIPSLSKKGCNFKSELPLLRSLFSLMHLISSRNASFWTSLMMCFSVSRYSLTSFALLQKCQPLHCDVPLQALAMCFRRAIPATKPFHVEYLVNFPVPRDDSPMCSFFTVSIGRIS